MASCSYSLANLLFEAKASWINFYQQKKKLSWVQYNKNMINYIKLSSGLLANIIKRYDVLEKGGGVTTVLGKHGMNL